MKFSRGIQKAKGGDVQAGIWESFTGDSVSPQQIRAGYEDVRKRIAARRRKRRRAMLTAGSAVAAGVLAGVILFGPQPRTDNSSMRLSEMAVYSDERVRMVADGRTIELSGEAAVVTGATGAPQINTDSGDTLLLRADATVAIFVPDGKRYDLTLADETHIWLNSNSHLEYPVSFAGGERVVSIVGEAFFDVARNENMPFVVNLPDGGSVRVLGTSFNVSAYPDEDYNAVTLLSGEVEYRSHSGKPVRLSPDMQAVSDRGGHIAVGEVNAAEFAMWRDGVLNFRDESLPSLARKLSRMYGIRIVVDERIASSNFSGIVRCERGLDYILDLLMTTSDIVCTVDNGMIYLR